MRKTPPDVEAQVIAAYRAQPQGGTTLARQFGIGGTTLYRMLARNGVPISEEKRRAGLFHRFALSEQQEAEAIERTNAGERSESIAKGFGVSKYTVLAMLKRRGVVTKLGKPKRDVALDELQKAATLYASGVPQVEIGKQLGVSQATISHWLRMQGISNRGAAQGSRHGSWTGGRSQNREGYSLMWLAADDPFRCMAMTTGYVMEHRYVMAQKIGRPLLSSESVHHINGDKADNRIENLELRVGKHGKGAAFVCADCGSRNIRACALTEVTHG